MGLFNSFYGGVRNTGKTTSDGNPPIEIIITAPTKLVTTTEGDSPLKTGEGIIPDYKEPESKEEKELLHPLGVKGIKKKGGLKGLYPKAETDADRKIAKKQQKFEKEIKSGKLDGKTNNSKSTK